MPRLQASFGFPAKQINDRLSMRAYARYRDSRNFWEDTNNNARSAAFGAPADIAAKGPYIPDLTARLAQIGSGSTYVIAELDGAYTKYKEVTLESEYRGERTFLRGSYTWSDYYGNIDQDNSTTGNDAAIFIGVVYNELIAAQWLHDSPTDPRG